MAGLPVDIDSQLAEFPLQFVNSQDMWNDCWRADALHLQDSIFARAHACYVAKEGRIGSSGHNGGSSVPPTQWLG